MYIVEGLKTDNAGLFALPSIETNGKKKFAKADYKLTCFLHSIWKDSCKRCFEEILVTGKGAAEEQQRSRRGAEVTLGSVVSL